MKERRRGAWRLRLPQVRKYQGKIFFMVREKSENFTSSQGKFESVKEVREKGSFKSTYLFLSLYLCCSLTFLILLYILRT